MDNDLWTLLIYLDVTIPPSEGQHYPEKGVIVYRKDDVKRGDAKTLANEFITLNAHLFRERPARVVWRQGNWEFD